MIRLEDDVMIVTPPERLTANNAPAMERAVVGEINKGITRVVIDCSDMAFMSSAGLRVVLKLAKMLQRNENGALALCRPNDEVSEVFEISGFMTLVEVYPSFAEAIKVVKDRREVG